MDYLSSIQHNLRLLEASAVKGFEGCPNCYGLKADSLCSTLPDCKCTDDDCDRCWQIALDIKIEES